MLHLLSPDVIKTLSRQGDRRSPQSDEYWQGDCRFSGIRTSSLLFFYQTVAQGPLQGDVPVYCLRQDFQSGHQRVYQNLEEDENALIEFHFFLAPDGGPAIPFQDATRDCSR